MEKINILASKKSIKPAAKYFFSDIKCVIKALLGFLAIIFLVAFATVVVIYSTYNLISNGFYVFLGILFIILMVLLFVFYVYEQYKKLLNSIKRKSKDLN